MLLYFYVCEMITLHTCRTFDKSSKETLYPLQQFPIPFCPQALEATNQVYVPMDLPV